MIDIPWKQIFDKKVHKRKIDKASDSSPHLMGRKPKSGHIFLPPQYKF